MMTREQAAQTIAMLKAAYPAGWKPRITADEFGFGSGNFIVRIHGTALTSVEQPVTGPAAAKAVVDAALGRSAAAKRETGRRIAVEREADRE